MIKQVLHITIPMTTPILLAGIGGLFTEIVGYLNIGLEGLMLLSAFFSAYVSNLTSSIFAGVFAGSMVSMGFAFIMVFFTERLKANLYIVGLATNLLASGLTVSMMEILLKSKGTIMFLNIPKMKTPFISGYTIFDYSSIVFVILTHIVVFKTRLGYNLRAIGRDRNIMDILGVNVKGYIYFSFVMSGFFCGLAGASLSIPLRSFVENMTSGRGWIALVAVVVSDGNPIVLLIFSFLFGFFTAISNSLQMIWKSSSMMFTIPYILTLLILIIHSTGLKRTSRSKRNEYMIK